MKYVSITVHTLIDAKDLFRSACASEGAQIVRDSHEISSVADFFDRLMVNGTTLWSIWSE
ncbi:unnamed protein product [Thlaspi arvense]|uniref:Uncharacterized protein n=1 Tax=Thlaspi arvense TaxID=13288 RepID=A0AAU9REB2_THLAR|nr:unnamed protein product [Thlaspi arvense]